MKKKDGNRNAWEISTELQVEEDGRLVIPREADGFLDDVLFGMDGVTAIEVEESNARYRAENCCLIDKTTETVIYAGQGAAVPAGVKAIGPCAFNWDSNRTGTNMNPFRLPDGLLEIGYRAFAITSDDKIHIIVPVSVKTVGIMSFMMKCGEDHQGLCEVTFLGDPELETGVFGTRQELADVGWDILHQLPGCVYTQEDEILVHVPEDSSVAAYCEKYKIPCVTLSQEKGRRE